MPLSWRSSISTILCHLYSDNLCMWLTVMGSGKRVRYVYMLVHMCASTYTVCIYSRVNISACKCSAQVSVIKGERDICVSSLLLLLTSLLTELLGQSILENDLSSVCCCGSERKKKSNQERKSINTNSTESKVNSSLLNIWRSIKHRWHNFPLNWNVFKHPT